MPTAYIYLVIAILAETIGTTALQASQQFTRLAPTVLCLVTYGASFWFMALALKTMPVGIVYAIWSGAGIVILALIDLFWFKISIDIAGFLGLALILAGVVVINLFSHSVGH